MLSSLLLHKYGLILMKDDLGEECLYERFFRKLLQEQNIDEKHIKSFKHYNSLEDIQLWLKKQCDTNKKWNIIIPPFSDLLATTEASQLIQCLNKLAKYAHIQRLLLWITPQNCNHDHAEYFIAAMEYMAEMVIHMQTKNQLTIVKRKVRGYGGGGGGDNGDTIITTGGICIKHYLYKRVNNQFVLELNRNHKNDRDKEKVRLKESSLLENTTFKIELDEDEIIARNALKLPYERTSDNIQSNITYIPDANDDLDDEDPDDDLCI